LSSILRIPGVILRKSRGSNQHGYLAQRQGSRRSRKITEHVEQKPNKRHKSSLFDLDDDVIKSLDDEYQQWCQRPRDRFALESPPLEFWTSYAIKKTFPRLQKMALDVFTIPAMSDEPERVFGSTGLMVKPH
jgi:hypothetical protein